MKTLTYSIQSNLSALHDELVATIPALSPTENPEGVLVPRLLVEGDSATVWLTMNSNISGASVDQVIAVHEPTVQQPDPRRDRLALIKQYTESDPETWTTSELHILVGRIAQELTA